jgi:hypothetical protein
MIDLALAKQHLRVLHSREDVLIQSLITAAEQQFTHLTERDLYADKASQDAAQTLIDSSQTELDAAAALPDADPDDIANQQAALDYRQQRLDDSVILNESITSGCLLLVGHLYVTRDIDAAVPKAIEYLWQPYKIYRVA